MAKLYNLARMHTATVGTGTITLGAAVSGFLTFAGAGVANGDIVSYSIRDGTNSEIGTGTYTSSGTTLTRTVLDSTNSNNAIVLSGSAQVFITPNANDFLKGRGAGYQLFIDDTSSEDVAGYILNDVYPGANQTLTSSSLTTGNDQLIFTLTTDLEQDDIIVLPGLIVVNISLKLGTLSRTASAYVTLLDWDGAFVQNVIGTSDTLTLSSSSEPVFYIDNPVDTYGGTGHRLILEIYANVSGAGSDGTITSVNNLQHGIFLQLSSWAITKRLPPDPPVVYTTPVGNITTGEDDLIVHQIDADTIWRSGEFIHFVASGTFANTVNNKRIRAYLHTTLIFDTGALAITSAQSWSIEGWIVMTGSASERCNVIFESSSTVLTSSSAYTDATVDLAADSALKLTGEATATNDVIQKFMIVGRA